MGEKLHSHRIGDGTGTTGNGIDLSGIKCSISPWTYFKGAIAHCMVWGGLQLGALSPVVTLAIYQLLGPRCAVLFLAVAILSVLAPSRHSPAFCCFYLGSAACVGGSTVWVPDKILQLLQGRGYLLLGRCPWEPKFFFFHFASNLSDGLSCSHAFLGSAPSLVPINSPCSPCSPRFFG